jgi:hypothetical protein
MQKARCFRQKRMPLHSINDSNFGPDILIEPHRSFLRSVEIALRAQISEFTGQNERMEPRTSPVVPQTYLACWDLFSKTIGHGVIHWI